MVTVFMLEGMYFEILKKDICPYLFLFLSLPMVFLPIETMTFIIS